MRGGSQISTKFREWKFETIEIRSTLVVDAPFAATEDSPTERGDLWILFLSIIDNDHWVAYGVVDSLIGEPEKSLDSIETERLKKLSILIGDSWFKIKTDPMAASAKHRELVGHVEQVHPEFEGMRYLDLISKRQMADWESLAIHWSKQGMVISLN